MKSLKISLLLAAAVTLTSNCQPVSAETSADGSVNTPSAAPLRSSTDASVRADDTDADEIAGPHIEFDSTTVDLGVIEYDGEADGKFHFKNSGNADLVLRSVFAGCTCTGVKYSTKPVAPGDTSSITVKFRARGITPGYFTKLIRVRSNADNNYVRIYLKGRIMRPQD